MLSTENYFNVTIEMLLLKREEKINIQKCIPQVSNIWEKVSGRSPHYPHLSPISVVVTVTSGPVYVILIHLSM